jgi:hypothetical protein
MFVGIGLGVGRQRFAGGFADSYSSRVLADGGTIEALSCVANASTLLQQASLLFIPSGYKAGVVYSALPNNGNGDLTWSRNSTANRTNSSGLIESVGANVPRLSYMYGSCPSALLEPQRTNLALYSEEFDNASWTKSNASITANSVTSPNGTTNADTFESTTNLNANITINQPITIVSGTTYSTSIYVKANTQRFIFINFSSSGSTQNFVTAIFDLNDFTLGQTAVGSTSGTLVSTSIQQVSNGFYRITIVASINRTDGRFRIGFASAKTGNFIGATGECAVTNTLGQSIYLWGAQLEAGAYPTTYIPTTSTTATRLADTFTRNNIYTNGVISASGGTWFVELKNNVALLADSATAGFWIGTSNTGTSNNGTFYFRQGGGNQRSNLWAYIGGSGSQIYVIPNDNIKLAIKWNGTTADVFANGVKVVSELSFNVSNMEFLSSGLGVGRPFFIQAMALFNEPKSDQFCIDLTT